MDKNQMMRFIAKRVAGELTPGTLVNLGVGIPHFGSGIHRA